MASSAPTRPPVVFTLDTSWESRHGGITTFNRNLAMQLAAAGARVYFLVPGPTVREQDDARAAGVTIVPWDDDEETLPKLPDGATPDLIIGHGRVTGAAARRLQRLHFPAAMRFQFLHTAPDEIEWHKTGRTGDPGMRAEERMQHELRLAADATEVFTVGPRLHDLYIGELSAIRDAPVPVEINPGFDDPEWSDRPPPPGRPRRALLTGRLEDAKIKGLDIGTRGLARALERLNAKENEAALVLRGVPEDQHQTLYERVGEWSQDRFRSITRSFSVDPEDLRADLRRATLLLMPSRAEAFGLVAAEAIALGTPVVISERSGLAQFLEWRLPSDEYRRLVVPVTGNEEKDTDAWGDAIRSVLRDPEAAFGNAGRLRQTLAQQQTWRMAAEVVLGRIPGAAVRPAPTAAPSTPTPVPATGTTRRRTWAAGLSAVAVLGLGGATAVDLWPSVTYKEIAGNRNGSPLYTDAGRTPVPDGRRIPYLTSVQVRCKVPDRTGMQSVSFWYHLASTPYKNLFSPSDTFMNGDPPGGGSTAVDPAVPDCANGQGA
ncbi:glycosyltransferase [Dactylosporangium sp. NPDC050688]|uniref:glycosyltransferase n=1 Tax=Dactylosporangium sp. NPDC050688 TaxID=3157217 RepID=UPI00340073C6